MVDVDGAAALVVHLKDVGVAVVPPPGAQLPVPAARQRVEELGVLHADHGEEVLVAEVPPEPVLLRQLGHVAGLQQPVVQARRSHGAEVQQHHAAVEARQAVGGRFPDFALGVFFAILPEGVSARGSTRTMAASVRSGISFSARQFGNNEAIARRPTHGGKKTVPRPALVNVNQLLGDGIAASCFWRDFEVLRCSAVVVVRVTKAFITPLPVWNLKTCSEISHSCVSGCVCATGNVGEQLSVLFPSAFARQTALRQEARRSRTAGPHRSARGPVPTQHNVLPTRRL